MPNYYRNDNVFEIDCYEIFFTRFADSILLDKFVDGRNELERILSNFYIPITSLIAGGGGKSKITQSLENELKRNGWLKEIIEDQHMVSGELRVSESHEIDHFKRYKGGNIALEIEWNNKDPFYDRDLENFIISIQSQ